MVSLKILVRYQVVNHYVGHKKKAGIIDPSLVENVLRVSPLVVCLFADSGYARKFGAFHVFEQCTTTSRYVAYFVCQTKLVDAGN